MTHIRNPTTLTDKKVGTLQFHDHILHREMKAYLVLTLLLFVVSDVQARRGGAPEEACDDLTPSHGTADPIDPANNPPEVFIYSELFDNDNGGSYEAGQTYSSE